MPVDYVSGLGPLPNPLRDINAGIMSSLGIKNAQLQNQAAQQQIDTATEKARQAQLFHNDVGTLLTHPTAQNMSDMIVKHPEFADQLKAGWDIRDEATKKADLTQLGEIYSAASAGKFDLAAKSARARFEADKAANQADPQEEEIVKALESGDPVEQKAALGMIGVHLAAVTGPEHFGTVFGALNKKNEGYTLGAGDVRIGDDNKVVAHSPFMKGADGTLYPWNDGAGRGGQASGEAGAQPNTVGMSPAAASVASTLTSEGLPSTVVAGFMGNFHVEGGYDGAQGDGGSASGIAQWHSDRAATFERVVGKPVTQASPAEQAKFVAWEMKNPEAAGMTVKQRDAILAAKTPSQAAALIDKFYERSSGKAVKGRMSAATAYATQAGSPQSSPGAYAGGALTPPKPKDAPSGYQYKADGTLVPIAGGPADKAKTGYRLMTPAENTAQGLDPNVRYQVGPNGQITALGGQDKSQGQLKPVPQAPKTQLLENVSTLREVDRAIALLTKNPDAIGFGKGNTPDFILQRTDSAGVPVRAAVGKIGGKIIHDVSGAAVTLSEAPRFQPYVPQLTDTAETALAKLKQLRVLAAADTADLNSAWGPDNGYRGVNLPGHSQSGAPVRVRSIQEAQKLPSGALFITPDGRTLRKR